MKRKKKRWGPGAEKYMEMLARGYATKGGTPPHPSRDAWSIEQERDIRRRTFRASQGKIQDIGYSATDAMRETGASAEEMRKSREDHRKDSGP